MAPVGSPERQVREISALKGAGKDEKCGFLETFFGRRCHFEPFFVPPVRNGKATTTASRGVLLPFRGTEEDRAD